MTFKTMIVAASLLVLAGQTAARIKLGIDHMPYAPLEPGAFDEGAEAAWSRCG
jgi:hypothetical protein